MVRKVLANRERVDIGRQRLLRENRELLQELMAVSFDGDEPTSSEPQDAFYAAWAEELITGTLRTLHAELLESGRADQFRVLFGRVCEGLTIAEVADCLGLPATTVENHFKRSNIPVHRERRLIIDINAIRHRDMQNVIMKRLREKRT